ncbi:SDR family oxidoreductase [Elusimicrobiota bacterium]
MANKKICLVTGGAGFIGSHIAENLLKKGFRVRIIDNFSAGKMKNIKNFVNKIKLIRGDIRNEKALAKALKNVSYVYHEAAIRSVPKSMDDPLPSNSVNAEGTLKVLVASKKAGVKLVTYASSSSAYGDGKVFPQYEELKPRPLSPYAVSKLAGEHYCQTFAKSFNLPTISLRYFNVYGPRQDPESIYSAVIPRFMELYMDKKPFEIHWDGKQERDFSYIEDVVNANLLALKAPSKAYGETFNIAGGKTYSILDIVYFLERLAGKKLPKKFSPMRAGDVRKTCANISKARRLLGFNPKARFNEGLMECWKYFKAGGNK